MGFFFFFWGGGGGVASYIHGLVYEGPNFLIPTYAHIFAQILVKPLFSHLHNAGSDVIKLFLCSTEHEISATVKGAS